MEARQPRVSPAEEAAVAAVAVVAMEYPQLVVTEAVVVVVAAAVAVVALFVFVLPVELWPVVVQVSAFVD